MREILAHDRVLRITAIDVVTGKARIVAEVFKFASTVGACPIGLVKPGNADAVAFFESA